MINQKPKVIFVYNADSGIFNLVADVAHKIFSPQTYACNLCALTHSNFGMKNDWKTYLDTLKNPLEFLHADEFNVEYQCEKTDLPAVFRQDKARLTLIIDAATLNQCRTLEDLQILLNERLRDQKKDQRGER